MTTENGETPGPEDAARQTARLCHDLINLLLAVRLHNDAMRASDDPVARGVHADAVRGCVEQAIKLIKAMRRDA